MEILQELQQFIKEFTNQQNAKNLSKNTISAYNRIFERFYDYLAGEIEDSQI